MGENNRIICNAYLIFRTKLKGKTDQIGRIEWRRWEKGVTVHGDAR